MRTRNCYCRACGRCVPIPAGAAIAKRLCRCGGSLVTEVALARAAGIPLSIAFDVRYRTSTAVRVELIAAYDAKKAAAAVRRAPKSETRTETRDGKEFTVTVIPPNTRRDPHSPTTHFHFAEVEKPGERRLPVKRKKKR